MFELYDSLPFSEQLLHWVHYLLCGFAVLIALIPLLTPKGSDEHKFGGMIYLPVSCAAFAIASIMAWRESSLVLLCFNVFCAYLLLSGWRAVHEKEKPVLIDWLIPGGLFALAVGVTLHGLIVDEPGKRGFYLMFFALNAYYLSLRDFKHLRRRHYWAQRKMFLIDPNIGHATEWLNRHVAGMVGSFLASLSVVVLTLLPIELHWLWPATLIVLAAVVAFREHRKKHRLRTATAKILQPIFTRDLRRRIKDDEDIRKAA